MYEIQFFTKGFTIPSAQTTKASDKEKTQKRFRICKQEIKESDDQLLIETRDPLLV